MVTVFDANALHNSPKPSAVTGPCNEIHPTCNSNLAPIMVNSNFLFVLFIDFFLRVLVYVFTRILCISKYPCSTILTFIYLVLYLGIVTITNFFMSSGKPCQKSLLTVSHSAPSRARYVLTPKSLDQYSNVIDLYDPQSI